MLNAKCLMLNAQCCNRQQGQAQTVASGAKLHIERRILYVQEVVNHSKLLYKMGHYFLNI